MIVCLRCPASRLTTKTTAKNDIFISQIASISFFATAEKWLRKQTDRFKFRNQLSISNPLIKTKKKKLKKKDKEERKKERKKKEREKDKEERKI